MTVENYHIAFVNLDHRTDRLSQMEAELSRVGISADRVRGMYPQEYQGDESKVSVMRRRTPGAIGCWMSQVRIMQTALAVDRHAWVMEDDLEFCGDLRERMTYVENWMQSHDWDIVWLGSSVHISPPWWHPNGPSKMPPDVSANLGRDAKRTDDPRILQCFGAFSTMAYIVNRKSIATVLRMLDECLPISIGIDHAMISMQPSLKTFCFLPGMVKQRDNMSDIGTGMTMWSGFLQLNGTRENSAYVYQNLMSEFNPDTFQWNEAR